MAPWALHPPDAWMRPATCELSKHGQRFVRRGVYRIARLIQSSAPGDGTQSPIPLLALEVEVGPEVPNPNHGLVFLVTGPIPKPLRGPPTATSLA